MIISVVINDNIVCIVVVIAVWPIVTRYNNISIGGNIYINLGSGIKKIVCFAQVAIPVDLGQATQRFRAIFIDATIRKFTYHHCHNHNYRGDRSLC